MYLVRIKNYTLYIYFLSKENSAMQDLSKSYPSNCSCQFKEWTQTLVVDTYHRAFSSNKQNTRVRTFLLTYFMNSQEENESCQCFFTAWDLASYQRTCHYFSFTPLPREYTLWWSSSRAGIRKSGVARYSKRIQAMLGLHQEKQTL